MREATVRRGDKVALDRLSLSLRVGDHTAILGPNGSGKSTLIQLLSGQVYPVAQEGDAPVAVFGRRRWNLQELRTRLGIVSADLHQRYVAGSSLGVSTARESVIASFFGSEVVFQHHRTDPEIGDAADAALERVGATHLAARRMSRLSTGEARRVLIARALVHNPEVIILDEPTTGLDAVARTELIETLDRLSGAGTTLILITHHFEEVIPAFGRVILLREGKIVADGQRERVMTSSLISLAFGARIDIEAEGLGFRAIVRQKSDHQEKADQK